MRKLVPILLVLAAPALAAPAAQRPASSPPVLLRSPVATPFARCNRGPTLARNGIKAERPQKLGELPPGKLYHTVVRSVDGCPDPAASEVRVGRR